MVQTPWSPNSARDVPPRPELSGSQVTTPRANSARGSLSWVSSPISSPISVSQNILSPSVKQSPVQALLTADARLHSPTKKRPGSSAAAMGSLVTAFNLRAYSTERRRFTQELILKARDIPLEEIDLLGGNGRWRQRKAEKEWARRAIEDEERRNQQKIEEERQRHRKAEMEARKRRQLKEEEKRRAQERESKCQEVEELERRRREEEERLRLLREQDERDWLARQPKICEKCGGDGKCRSCDGRGFTLSMFLVSNVSEEKSVQYGRVQQGCEDCGGFKHGIMGELRKGNGKCVVCGGTGKIFPKLDPSPGSPSFGRMI